jgi:hypothetical protein
MRGGVRRCAHSNRASTQFSKRHDSPGIVSGPASAPSCFHQEASAHSLVSLGPVLAARRLASATCDCRTAISSDSTAIRTAPKARVRPPPPPGAAMGMAMGMGGGWTDALSTISGCTMTKSSPGSSVASPASPGLPGTSPAASVAVSPGSPDWLPQERAISNRRRRSGCSLDGGECVVSVGVFYSEHGGWQLVTTQTDPDASKNDSPGPLQALLWGQQPVPHVSGQAPQSPRPLRRRHQDFLQGVELLVPRGRCPPVDKPPPQLLETAGSSATAGAGGGGGSSGG